MGKGSERNKNLIHFLTYPHRERLINADGHGKVWTDWNDASKFFQYGWRCTTNENSYCNRTLMGNWNQERYDLRNIVQPKPLPSQFQHCFETTYDTSYNSKMPLSTHTGTLSSSIGGRSGFATGICSKALSQTNKQTGAGDLAQWCLCLPCKHKILSSIPGTKTNTTRFKREPHWFPGHQPELDPPRYKCTEKSTYMKSYSKPQIRHHFGCVWAASTDQS
ncbi:UPF0686 protein C11orf1 homolog isoform X2 [Heterocephalus glaber]|uniref:UPF0686 protein C11orf1 homolog isoform X2 n=1 Tax=Heterocephalus glaber TaxID=10181 RepID=A0AAX6R8A2_HETGA|nr:UPF0686 protein C11orf1 homolog isoform X2 [Heterocephalus glaber]